MGAYLHPVTTDEDFLEALPLMQQLLVEEGNEYSVPLPASIHLHSWKRAQSQGYSLYLHRDEGKNILGVMGLIELYDPLDEKPFFRINNFIVIETARNKGIGKAMMVEAENIARKAGCQYIVLEVTKNNQRVQSFYSKQDYKYICDRLIKNISI